MSPAGNNISTIAANGATTNQEMITPNQSEKKSLNNDFDMNISSAK
jgi:hypothetical protein